MKTCIVFSIILATGIALPQRGAVNPVEIVVLKETPSNNIGVDGYHFAYELSDGTRRDESAQIEVKGAEDALLRVQGSYSWVNPVDGQTYTVTYIADENGFQPQGAHLPSSKS